MEKNIVLIPGHPSENSFCKELLAAYQKGTESVGANFRTIYLSRLNFKINLADGYRTAGASPPLASLENQ